jgi:FkbM family methyltransferase
MATLRKLIRTALGPAASRRLVTFLSPLLTRLALLRGAVFNSWSQYGEDRVVDQLLGIKTPGTYIDIGANDPNLFNNTRRFYGMGWSGANCEPDPTKYERLLKSRPRDLNFNCGVGSGQGLHTFYRMSADMLSTFSKAAAIEYERQGYVVIEEVPTPLMSLTDVFDRIGRPVDFISLDVEGFEIDVLKSNDWSRHRPTLLLVEMMHEAKRIEETLAGVGYEIVWRNSTNAIFRQTPDFGRE